MNTWNEMISIVIVIVVALDHIYQDLKYLTDSKLFVSDNNAQCT